MAEVSDDTPGAAPDAAVPDDQAAPPGWTTDGLLTDGVGVRVRPIRSDDADALIEFHAGLSQETVHFRFFSAHPRLSTDEVRRFTRVDYRDRMAFVAEVAGRMVGVSRYDRTPGTDEAEAAFVVADDFQGRGVGTIFVEHLVAYARTQGIDRFVADVLPENSTMLGVFAAAGLQLTRAWDQGTVRVEIDLRPTAAYLTACDNREATAEAASLATLLRPRSIAVVGAGREPGGVGHGIVRALLAGDFAGTVYPVNPHARSVCGVPAFPDLTSLPEPIDLAVFAVPVGALEAVVAEAASLGVHAAVVITSGLAETGGRGRDAEAELLDVARRAGMRVVGPNCLGVVNTDPTVRMNATFGGAAAPPGGLAVISQSGAVGVVLVEQATRSGLGLSLFVSMGNKLDVSSNDLLCFIERDERTQVVALYLESFGNPRKFARVARRVGQTTPIVALKAGRTPAGARGARSHTAANATPEVVTAALLRGAGVIEVASLEELTDVSTVLLSAPLPAGRRVALVGNSGGPLILAADACASAGLDVPELSDTTTVALERVVDPAGAIGNPVDLTSGGDAATLARTLDLVAADRGVDAVIVVVTDLPALSAAEARAAVTGWADRSPDARTVPVIACILGAERPAGTPGHQSVAELPSPERAAIALARVAAHAAWRRAVPAMPEPTWWGSTHGAQRMIAAELERVPGGGWLDAATAAQLLETAGVPVAPTLAARDVGAALAAAEQLGYPVALKAGNGELVHKTEAGGVILDLADPEALTAAFEQLSARLGPAMMPAVVQPMAGRGVEAIVGLTVDAVTGPVVMVGLGGVLTDLVGDHAFGIPPLVRAEVEAMVASLRAAPLLDGYRGAPAVDREALVELVETVGQLAEALPEIAELDCNPVIVTPAGALVVDAKVRIAPPRRGPDPLIRALSSVPGGSAG
ncbi:MAG: GNAT family N-acetyltransferase [Actinomycetota bacterium]|nr:GNAT family N-acetyltransferase [Actinomycetota bacterium]